MADLTRIKKIKCTENHEHEIDAIAWDGYETSNLATIDGRNLLGGGDIATMEEVTYEDLVWLRDSGYLIPGKQYRIINYISEDTQYTLHPFDIIVTADTTDSLNEKARACIQNGDTYFSENGANLDAWQIWYCLDNDKNRFVWADHNVRGRGVIYRMIDEWGNDCPYDFKNVQFERWCYESGDVLPTIGCVDKNAQTRKYFYTFSYIDENGEIHDYSVKGNSGSIAPFEPDTGVGVFKNIIAPRYTYTKLVGDSIVSTDYPIQTLNNIVFVNTLGGVVCENTFDAGCYNNTLGSAAQKNIFGQGCYNNILGQLCVDNVFGEGFHNNVLGDLCGSNIFGNGCGSNILVTACKYNHFEDGCTDNELGGNSNYNSFGGGCCENIIGESCGSNTFGKDCVNNIFGNVCERNTFGNGCSGNTFANECSYNIFEINCDSNTFDIKCTYNTFGSQSSNNTFGEECRKNTLGIKCTHNTFHSSCGGNTFGTNCDYNTLFGNNAVNTFGNTCYNNTLGESSSYNIFGNLCSNNLFDGGCNKNILSNSCVSNQFNADCIRNSLGSECTAITLFSGCKDNSFGNACANINLGERCNGNSFGNYCQYNNFQVSKDYEWPLNRCCSNHFDDGCSFIRIVCNKRNNSDYLKNININRGVCGTSQSAREIIFIHNINSENEINVYNDKGHIYVDYGDINVTYEQLKTLVANKQLTPGRDYRIIDYVTTTSQENTKSAGHQFDIIVTALDENTLSEEAKAIQHDGDDYFANSNLSAWKIWYSLDNDTYKFAWAGNSRVDKTYTKLEYTNECEYAFTIPYQMDDEVGKNQFDEWVVVRGKMINDTEDLGTYDQAKLNEVFSHWDYMENADGDFILTMYPILIDGVYQSGSYQDNGLSVSEYYQYDGVTTIDGIDYDLWKKSDVINGEYSHVYLITDRIVTTKAENPYFYTHSETVELEPKGIIYRMIDEFNNDCPYDFKNIMFTRMLKTSLSLTEEESEANSYSDCYTFTWIDNNNILRDASLKGFEGSSSVVEGEIKGKMYSNIIKSYNVYTHDGGDDVIVTQTLNNIVFLSSYKFDMGIYYGCYNNIFANGCYNNSFNNACNNNTFGNGCHDNTFDNGCYGNTLGKFCYDNTFGNDCYNNTFDTDCNNNTFDTNCYHNTLGFGCYDNTFDTNCRNNTFGDACYDNTFDTNCRNNTFGEFCHRNTFDSDCHNNTFGDDCCDNTFDGNCHDNGFSSGCASNTFSVGCASNTFELVCSRNTFGSGCYSNTFGDNCCDNTFGNNCYDNGFRYACRTNTFGSTCYTNTFDIDCCDNTFSNGCNTNTFGVGCYANTFGVGCYGNTFDQGCHSNTFGSNCYTNTFDIDCYENTFGIDCSDNNFIGNCYINAFGDNCYLNTLNNTNHHNTFGSGCYNNTFGNNCYHNDCSSSFNNNTFGSSCYYNSFSVSCRYITFGNSCYYNTFKSNCNGIKFTSNCYGNSIGNSCSYIYFGSYATNNNIGNNCYYIIFGTSTTSLLSYYRNIIVDSYNRYIKLQCTSTTSNTKFYQNVRICLGVNNTSSYKTITDANTGQAYETTVTSTNSISKKI